MAPSLHETQRIRRRFDVDLKAEVSITGSETHEHQCRVTNLSASGACLQFTTTVSCRIGMNVAIKIFIPETIMHISNSGEIIWVKQQDDQMRLGIRFSEILSEIMMQRMVKNGVPVPPYKAQ
jgi:hypothetical protein